MYNKPILIFDNFTELVQDLQCIQSIFDLEKELGFLLMHEINGAMKKETVDYKRAEAYGNAINKVYGDKS